MIEFKLPSLGSDMDEGKLVQWNIAPGQVVKKGDVVAVVDSTKAAVDVEIWVEGTVHRLLTQVGQTIPVGTTMALLLEPGEQAGSVAAPVPVAPVPASAPTPASEAAPADAPVSASAPVPVPVPAPAPAPARQRVSPAARQRASELGVDLAGVTGTGPQGAVTREDVERALAPNTPGVIAPLDRASEMRRSIAAAMGRSKREIPHYYLSETVPLRKVLDWLQEANRQRPVTARLLLAALLLKAVAVALRDFPEINGRFEGGVYRPGKAAHIGVAISLRQGGLIAPALHDVGARELDTVMLELADLVKRCRAGSLRSSEMSDPTITVTNLGDQGVEQVFGVIYPPQVALVGFGRVHERPWVQDGRVLPTPVIQATLSADHRVSDGHRGAMFLARLGELLQRPEEL